MSPLVEQPPLHNQILAPPNPNAFHETRSLENDLALTTWVKDAVQEMFQAKEAELWCDERKDPMKSGLGGNPDSQTDEELRERDPKNKKGRQLRFRTDRTISASDLMRLFQQYGRVFRLNLNRDTASQGSSTGCGTVRFKTAEQAAAAVQGLHRTLIRGHMLYCERRDQLSWSTNDPTRLFVAWPDRTPEQVLAEVFLPILRANGYGEESASFAFDVVLDCIFKVFGEVDYVITVPDKFREKNDPDGGGPDRGFVKFLELRAAEAAMRAFQDHPGFILRVAGPPQVNLRF